MPSYPTQNTLVGIGPGGNKIFVKSGGTMDMEAGAIAKFGGVNISGQLDPTTKYVAVGSALTLTLAAHFGKTMLLDTAAGSTATLPPATGSGAIYRFLVMTVATSNSHIIKVANGTDVMQGLIFSVDDTSDNAVGFIAGATADTITLNRTTTGSVSKGEYIEVEDIASNIFQVRGFISNSGTPATPFSATV
jgi:hypothetical protein